MRVILARTGDACTGEVKTAAKRRRCVLPKKSLSKTLERWSRLVASRRLTNAQRAATRFPSGARIAVCQAKVEEKNCASGGG
jgi:hypothetical protein